MQTESIIIMAAILRTLICCLLLNFPTRIPERENHPLALLASEAGISAVQFWCCLALVCLFTSEDKGEADNVAAESWPLDLFDEKKGLFD